MVINGPNLNMVGIREKNIYGSESYDTMIQMIKDHAAERSIEVECLQSNHEGDLIDWIQRAYFEGFDGIVMNPGGYTHTSIAIADAVKAIDPIPVIEVHISNISEREEFRQISYLAPYCFGRVIGEGLKGYLKAMDMIIDRE